MTIRDLPYPVPIPDADHPRHPRDTRDPPPSWRRFLKPDEKWVDDPRETS